MYKIKIDQFSIFIPIMAFYIFYILKSQIDSIVKTVSLFLRHYFQSNIINKKDEKMRTKIKIIIAWHKYC